jgi:hypothetical protein
MIYVDGRSVYIKTGPKSQTVNICTSENKHGVYESRLRISPPVECIEARLDGLGFKSTKDLVAYVADELRGNLEVTSIEVARGGSAGGPVRKVLLEKSGDRVANWNALALRLLEQSIDQLVLDFVQNPYLHRVEHSIHAELFSLLSQHRIFSAIYAGRGFSTQTVHKEWPEFRPRPEKRNRRGNFDICLLSPSCIERASRPEFQGGHIEPFAAVELGLDYSFKHLTDDCRKLVNSEIENAYAIHLVREDVTDDFDGVERFLAEASPVKTAYARVTGPVAIYKLTSMTSVREVCLSEVLN